MAFLGGRCKSRGTGAGTGLARLWNGLRRRARRRPPGPPPAAPPLAPPADALARVARGFAGEPPDLVALARASLTALLPAAPWDRGAPAPTPADLAWLDAAFARLAALPEPLAPPPGATGLSWRYLTFARALCDALEAAHAAALRADRVTRCPLTDGPDRNPVPRARVKPAERARWDCAGLGALLAGARLPEAGRRQVLAALARGIDWTDSAAFWASAAAAAPPTGAPSPWADSAPATPRDSGVPEPADLRPAVRAALGELVASPAFNVPHGDGWHVHGAFWVAAKPFAERLLARPELRDRSGPDRRRTLYRDLAAQGLLLPHGARPVWTLFVGAPDQPRRRYASALKLPAALYAGAVPCPVYSGTLGEARPPEARRD